jgi:multidrug resistance efflux pump
MLTKYGPPLLAVLGLGFAIFSVQHMKPGQVHVVPLLPPPSSPFEKQIGAAGLVESASEDIAIGVPVPALVLEVFVRPGDTVRRNQPLLRLDDRDLRAELVLRESQVRLAEAHLERLRHAPRAEDVPPAEARVAEAKAALADAETQLRLIESVRDPRAVRAEEVERRRAAVQIARARLAEAEAMLARLRAGSWERDIDVAEAELITAQKAVERVRTELERLTVRAPLDGRILQVNIRAGEFAQPGAPKALILMGAAGPLHVRADVDEKDAWRVRPGAGAVASVRGNAALRYQLSFVRIEPYVVPKRNLTGETVERTDTRVLQVIYRLPEGARVYAGQQVDVFIEER